MIVAVLQWVGRVAAGLTSFTAVVRIVFEILRLLGIWQNEQHRQLLLQFVLLFLALTLAPFTILMAGG